ncbi:MAG: hypothetical protein KC561_19725, partial [Myxococcales bacterium]|nr:hypothetical protein [Myxococcales bacterium]
QAFFQALANDPPPLHLARWIADYPDPDNFMTLFATWSGNNDLGFESPEYDDVIERAGRLSDSSQRRILYDRAQRLLLNDEAAIAPLYINSQNHLISPQLMGFELNPMDIVYWERLRWEE